MQKERINAKNSVKQKQDLRKYKKTVINLNQTIYVCSPQRNKYTTDTVQ